MIYRGFRVIEVRLYYISIITIIVLLCFNYIKKKIPPTISSFPEQTVIYTRKSNDLN